VRFQVLLSAFIGRGSLKCTSSSALSKGGFIGKKTFSLRFSRTLNPSKTDQQTQNPVHSNVQQCHLEQPSTLFTQTYSSAIWSNLQPCSLKRTAVPFGATFNLVHSNVQQCHLEQPSTRHSCDAVKAGTMLYAAQS
jgi:hypothetical protein